MEAAPQLTLQLYIIAMQGIDGQINLGKFTSGIIFFKNDLLSLSHQCIV